MNKEEKELVEGIKQYPTHRELCLIHVIERLDEELNNLQKENLEIRDWKYVIDTPLDLDKLKELDIIKIKGKEYISKNIYDELQKDKEALIRNYDKVLELLNKE